MRGEHHPGERIEVLTRPVTPIVCPMELLLRSDEHREQRHNLQAPDDAAAGVQARAPLQPSLQASPRWLASESWRRPDRL
jgi:hypothetical protein